MRSIIVHLPSTVLRAAIYDDLIKQLPVYSVQFAPSACIVSLDHGAPRANEYYMYVLQHGIAINHHLCKTEKLFPWNHPNDKFLRDAYKKQFVDRPQYGDFPPPPKLARTENSPIYITADGDIIDIY